jgi:pyruvate/2-oxoglutarate dehydrogenase complex dihydrolipoamide dehydrogenase (E3) component
MANIDANSQPTSPPPRIGRRSEVGTWKAVVDVETDEILGAALLGPEAGEVATVLQMAMLGGLRWQQVRDAVITHPTVAEGLNLLFDALGPDDGAPSPEAVPSG